MGSVRTVRICLFVLNIFLFLFGIGLLAFGIYLRVNEMLDVVLSDEISGKLVGINGLDVVGFTMIMSGVIILFLASFGCGGA